jgi:hypothetical protein
MWYKGFDGRRERQERHRDALMERESEQLKLLMEIDRYRETIQRD